MDGPGPALPSAGPGPSNYPSPSHLTPRFVSSLALSPHTSHLARFRGHGELKLTRPPGYGYGY